MFRLCWARKNLEFEFYAIEGEILILVKYNSGANERKGENWSNDLGVGVDDLPWFLAF